MEQRGVVAGNFALIFSLNFWAFLCISKAPFVRSLWSGHHWKDLFLLQKLSIDDANFGQKWWRQKRKKGQGSSQAVTGGTGVNGLSLLSLNACTQMYDLRAKSVQARMQVGCHWILSFASLSANSSSTSSIRRIRVFYVFPFSSLNGK